MCAKRIFLLFLILLPKTFYRNANKAKPTM
jgi:hypothetical protein